MPDIDFVARMGQIIEASYKTHPDLTWEERVQRARDEIEFGKAEDDGESEL